MSLNVNDKYLLIAHNRVYGIPDAFRDYLVEKKLDTVVFIAHPLDKTLGDSFMQVYKHGEKTAEVRIARSTKLGFLNFIIDTIITCYWVMFKLPSFNICVGNDNLNALSGLILRYFNKVNKVVYYAMDYSNQRLNNYILNNIYHKIETFCVKNSDEVWVTSKGIAYAREKYLGISPIKYKQKLVPTGVWSNKERLKPFSKINKHQLFFLGHLLEKQGLQKVLEAIPLIVKRIKDFKFIVVGGGEYYEELLKKVDKLNISDYVVFTGIIEKPGEIFEIMSLSAIGIAPYRPEKDKSKNFTYFADPGKIKDYLNAGLPVIMTDVSYNARELARKGCAIVVGYDSREIAEAVVKMMLYTSKLLNYRQNAIKESKNYDWYKIFDKAVLSLV